MGTRYIITLFLGIAFVSCARAMTEVVARINNSSKQDMLVKVSKSETRDLDSGTGVMTGFYADSQFKCGTGSWVYALQPVIPYFIGVDQRGLYLTFTMDCDKNNNPQIIGYELKVNIGEDQGVYESVRLVGGHIDYSEFDQDLKAALGEREA